MGRFVIVAYKPKAGHEAELEALVAKHQRVLADEDLITERSAYVMRSADGTLLEVFEWRSAEAIEKAHASPAMGALWAEFAVACDFVPLATLAESKEMFAEFDSAPAPRREDQIDYIEFPAKSLEGLSGSKEFFAQVFGWSYKDWGPTYADTPGSGLPSGLSFDSEKGLEAPLAVIFTGDLESVYRKVVEAGGEITRETFSFPGGRRFHFREPSGNELAVWSDAPAT